MKSRIDIKIAVVGNPKAGKETFCKMLFLESATRIRVNPLSKLGEVYMEIDPINFKHSSKSIISECTEHNNLIMKQTSISLDRLREENIDPYFYRYCQRIRGLINETEAGRINRNILLTFYFVGNIYTDFTKELGAANIIIYLTSANDKFDTNDKLFEYLVGLIKQSNSTKYMLTIVNKCDTTLTNISEIDNIIKEVAQQNNIQNNLLPPITMSIKYASIYRQIFYNISTEIRADDKQFICKYYNVRPENLLKDIQRNTNNYLSKTGYYTFQKEFLKVLNKNYRLMVDQNFDRQIDQLGSQQSIEKFVIALHSIKNKAYRLSKIFSKNYNNSVVERLKELLDKILVSDEPDTMIVDQIQEIYGDNNDVAQLVKIAKDTLRDKLLQNVTKKLYTNEITIDSFLPTKVYPMFEQLINSYPSKGQTDKLSEHICQLYSSRIKFIYYIVDQKNTLQMLYNAYYTETETQKLMSMLDEIKSMMDFTVYKNYLLQILLTKLKIAELIIEYQTIMPLEILESIVSYCKSLRYYLLNNNCKKYDYLFINISDICTRIIFELGSVSNAKYLLENIESIINFKPDRIINLDKFIIKMIKKTNYQAVVAEDEVGSNEDSDVDIYDINANDSNDDSNFQFTKDELATSDSEEYDIETLPGKRLNNSEQIEV